MVTPNTSQDQNKYTKNKKKNKKIETRSRSSSSTRSTADRLDEQLAMASKIILLNEDLSINIIEYQYNWKFFKQ